MISRNLIKRARGMISRKHKWCKGSYGIDKHGDRIDSYNVANKHSEYKPVQMCIMGAVFRAGHVTLRHSQDTIRETGRFLGECARELKNWEENSADAITYNDLNDTTHDDIMALCDYAMAKLEPKSLPRGEQ